MADQESNNKEENKIIHYSGSYGGITYESKFWNDFEDIGEKELLKLKIVKIKIFSGKYNEKECISGINVTFKNLFTGELKNTSDHRGSDDFIDVKEINIQDGEFLTDFHIRFKNEADYISQLGYSTNKKHEILVGTEEGEDKIIISNGGDNIIVGTFGSFNKRLGTTGVLYVKKIYYINLFLFGFFMVRHLIKKEPEFKEKIEKNLKEFEVSYQYLWRTLNLPDNIFYNIIKYCYI